MSDIVYIAHDLNDPAIARRVRMLHAAGVAVRLTGFFRGEKAPSTIDGAPVMPLAQTRDAALVQRIGAVIGALLRPAALRAAAGPARVIVARNLEALALGVRLKRQLGDARLVYECLDIHRLLLSRSRPARALQRVEASLLRHVDLVIVSSPAFARDYFANRPTLTAPVMLVENKLLALGASTVPVTPPQPAAGPPWTIGWLGNLRCRRTRDELLALARRREDRVRVLVAGRPSPAVFDDLAADIAAAPHCTYLGPYGVADQPDIYAQCHFAWTIDWFEEGLNSSWLLPNRLYEAQAHGVVPIALRSVETGRWLATHGTGLLVDDALAELDSALQTLDANSYAAMRDAVDALPRESLIATQHDCEALARAIIGA